MINEHWVDEEGNPVGGISHGTGFTISWQTGPIKDDKGNRRSPNGAFVETVLLAVADRISFYQETKFACPENQTALDGIYIALKALNERTERRSANGKEGTHKV